MNAMSAPEPVGFTDEPAQASDTVSWAWLPAVLIAAWLEFAYVVPAVADWLTEFLQKG